MSQPIILYDLPGKGAIKAVSGNVYKTRYTLAYKGLAFKTVWVEFQDVEERMKAIGAQPTGLKPDGSGPLYTVPTIQDPSTGAVTSDSFAIAAYLDHTYPSTPRVFPRGAAALIGVFDAAFMQRMRPMFLLLAAQVPKSDEYFWRHAEKRFGTREVSPEGPQRERDWEDAKSFLGVVDGWYSKSGGKWIMGDTFSYADMIVGAWIKCFSVAFDKDRWEAMSSWHGGRWAGVVEEMDKYPILD